MNIVFTFKNFEPSEHLSQHVKLRFDKLERFLSKSGNVEAFVILSVDKYRHIADIKIIGDSINLSAVEETNDMYGTVDLALDKIVAQVKKQAEQARRKQQKQQSAIKANKNNMIQAKDNAEDVV